MDDLDLVEPQAAGNARAQDVADFVGLASGPIDGEARNVDRGRGHGQRRVGGERADGDTRSRREGVEEPTLERGRVDIVRHEHEGDCGRHAAGRHVVDRQGEFAGLIDEVERLQRGFVAIEEQAEVAGLGRAAEAANEVARREARAADRLEAREHALGEAVERAGEVAKRFEVATALVEHPLDRHELGAGRRKRRARGGERVGDDVEGERCERGDLEVRHRRPEADDRLEPFLADAARRRDEPSTARSARGHVAKRRDERARKPVGLGRGAARETSGARHKPALRRHRHFERMPGGRRWGRGSGCLP